MQQRYGNAAMLYETAVSLLNRAKSDLPDFDEKELRRWQDASLDEIPLEKVRKMIAKFEGAIHYVDLASRSEYCMWDYPVREEGIRCVMPTLAGFRTLARLLVVKARLQAHDGGIDEAIQTLRIGISMGRDVGDGPFLVQGLVGIAVNALMFKEVQQLIETPDAPNLYWALASLPEPLVDMRRAMQVEASILYVELPELQTLETEVWSEEKALRLGGKVAALLSAEEKGLDQWMMKAGMLATAMRAYPEAKKQLLQQGRPAAQVESMPPLQVILIHKHQQYRRVRDMQFK